MAYAIQTKDKPDHFHLRLEVREAHLAYLEAHKDKLLAAGGLIDDDGTGGHGGILLVDTDERAEAEAFVAGDPFTKAGLFESVTVTRWRKAYFNFECLL
jgi:uncharacterized protein YciI